MLIKLVPIQDVKKTLILVSDLLKPIFEESPLDINLQALTYSLIRGTSKLVVICDESNNVTGINVLQITKLATGKKVLIIPITSGTRMPDCIDDFFELCHKIARENNCVELRGYISREGWRKVLVPHGWESAYTTIKCKVKP